MSWRVHATILAALALTACRGDNMADLREYLADVKAREPGAIEPLPEIKQVDTFTYLGEDRRNPFEMDRDTAEAAPAVATNGIAPDPLRRKEELEQFSLDSLRMLGTLEQDAVIWGLIRSPDGTLHRVRTGNYIGMNHGEIIGISDEEIELTQIVPDGSDAWREQRVTIALTSQ